VPQRGNDHDETIAHCVERVVVATLRRINA